MHGWIWGKFHRKPGTNQGLFCKHESGNQLWLSLQRSYSVTVRFKYSPMLPRKSEEPHSGGKTGPLNRECQLLPFTCIRFPTCIMVLYCHCCWSYSKKRTPECQNFPPVLLAFFPWLYIDIHTYIYIYMYRFFVIIHLHILRMSTL